MLPFLDPKKSITTIMSARAGKPGHQELQSEQEAPGSEIDPSLKSASEDILAAIEAKSPIDLAQALKAAFAALDSEEPAPESEPQGD